MSPAVWSYRDLVFVCLLAWLRQIGMKRPTAAEVVDRVKGMVSEGELIRTLSADSRNLLINEENTSRFEDHPNQLPFSNIFELMSRFDMLEPVDELRHHGPRRVWGPHLVTPANARGFLHMCWLAIPA